MTSDKTNFYLMNNGKFLDPAAIPTIRKELDELDQTGWDYVEMLQLKDPMMVLVISLFGGSLGIDRFMLGEVGLGLLKLFTCGGLGIWTLVDWFLISDLTKTRNTELLLNTINYSKSSNGDSSSDWIQENKES